MQVAGSYFLCTLEPCSIDRGLFAVDVSAVSVLENQHLRFAVPRNSRPIVEQLEQGVMRATQSAPVEVSGDVVARK